MLPIKITNKKIRTTVAGSVALASAMFFSISANAGQFGTDILHFTDHTVMTNSGVEPGATGTVLAFQREQGHADNQKLILAVKGLDTNSTYGLVAAFDSDTNFVDVASFVTDGKGNAILDYVDLGNGHGGGHKALPLPTNVNPVSLIREVDIVNTNMQVVLSADLTVPNHLEYLIKRDLSTNDVRALLQIEATAKRTHFRLFATGLATNTDYLLAFNGEVVQTNTTSAKGRLDIHSLTETPPFILDVRSVALWDTSSNVVLQTELPSSN
jgi:hypothetical protein